MERRGSGSISSQRHSALIKILIELNISCSIRYPKISTCSLLLDALNLT